MTGTIVNTLAVIAGSLMGLAAGKRLPGRIKEILMQALGLGVLYIGLKMALVGDEPLIPIACVLIGGLTGELLRIQQGLERLAAWLKRKLDSGSPTFVDGFVSSSVMYLVGPMTILGCIDDGLTGDPHTLYIKSIFDLVASFAMASSLGVGVIFSAASVLVVQGLLTMGASWFVFMKEPQVLNAVTSTGGVMILGIGIILLDIKKIRMANLLPALVFAVVLALAQPAIADAFAALGL